VVFVSTKPPGTKQHGTSGRHGFLVAFQKAFQLPFVVIGRRQPHRQFPGRSLIPRQRFLIVFVGVQIADPAGPAHQRENQFAQFERHPVAVNGGLNLRLLSVPGGAFGRSAGQVRQDFAVILVFDFIQFSGAQLKRLQLAPLPVGPALSLGGLNDQLPDGPAFAHVDFIENLALAAGVGSRGLAGLHFVSKF
jgi:hypothetical protein